MQKGKGKQKSPGKDLENTQHAGMLDAYTDGSSSSPITKDDTKPVTKKNKNQKKREAEKLRKLSESESKPEVPEVIDSWEDLESNTDETQVPRSIEFPVKPAVAAVESLAEEVQKLKIEEDKSNKQDGVKTKLETLESTMAKLDALFAKKEVPMPIKKEVKPEAKPEVKSDKKTEKTAEEIKAEREAKKKAKAAAKDKAKNKDNDQNDKPPLQEKKEEPSQKSTDKSPEEIKAEREAKKKAKQAAKEMSKNKSKDPQDKQSAAVEKPVEKPTIEKPKVEGEKSKAELKRERREKQEEQRRKKEEEAAKKKEDTKKEKVKRVPDEIQADRASVEKKLAKRLASQQISARTKAQRKVMLFSHLHQYEREFSLSRSYPIVGAHIHPSILTLGLQYADGIIAGSNARCVGLMKALKDFICDYTTPENSELSRDLNDKLKPQITFLKECRPISVSMGNAIRFIKSRINAVPNGTSEIDAKEGLIETIDEFVQHNIILAAEQIAITACEKICDGDVILTYGW